MKDTSLQPVTVHGIENADKNPKAINAWVQQINKLHQNKPVSAVKYTKPMPDIESLMQEWPAEMERTLQEVRKEGAERRRVFAENVERDKALVSVMESLKRLAFFFLSLSSFVLFLSTSSNFPPRNSM